MSSLLASKSQKQSKTNAVDRKTAAPAAAEVDEDSEADFELLASKGDEKKKFQLPMQLAGVKGKMGKNLRVKAKLYVGGTLGVNASAGKYILNFGSNNFFPVNSVQLASEWGSFDQIFDEFFILSMKVTYLPTNKYSANASASASASGSPGFLNTLGSTWTALQHDQLAYSDTSSYYVRAMASNNSKWANLSDKVVFVWKNVEKFSFDGVALPQQTGTGAQAWMNVSTVNTYGGFIQCGTPEPSGASAGLGTLFEGSNFGFFMAEFNVAFRCRS